MRIQCALLSSIVLVTAGIAAPPPGYKLKWHDEFDGNVLNSNYWNVIQGLRRVAINTDKAVTVTNGCLVLTTYTEQGKNYTGFVNTRGKVLSGYGYYEASIQSSNTPGNWSAFWLQSPYIMQTNVLNNPKNGVEIDVFEHRFTDAHHVDWTDGGDHALHWNGYDKKFHKSSVHFDPNLGVRSGFHTYGLLWTSNSYSFFVDGRQTWTTNHLVSSISEFVLLSSEIEDKGWAGDVPEGGYPGLADSQIKMYVDYVRYYAPPSSPSRSP